jgi:predicted DNA-binding transcriptional regulator AlpA
MDSLLNQKQAARILGLSVRTLERYRITGTGPRYVRLGRLIRYRPNDLKEWIELTCETPPPKCHGGATVKPPEAPSIEAIENGGPFHE